mmetsp:Transcript_21347/g.29709  ORF Transcript_21347/g.29709 Transcript_21347/m.29709 type:complete len:86 (-) Transcript_21347:1367-1624(-)
MNQLEIMPDRCIMFSSAIYMLQSDISLTNKRCFRKQTCCRLTARLTLSGRQAWPPLQPWSPSEILVQMDSVDFYALVGFRAVVQR